MESRIARTVPKTALVLCGGGVTGAVYELGALAALNDFFVGGFQVSGFDIYVGTSAGAFLATLMAAGVSPGELARSVMGGSEELMPVSQKDVYRADAREVLGIARDLTTILGTFLARAVRRRELPLQELAKDLEDALPAGIFSLAHYERWLIRSFEKQRVPLRFADIPRELYVTAIDLDSGQRAVFGARAEDPALRDVSIPKAICASSAIPGFFEPVEIGGRDFIDGAVGEAGHLDVALARGAELVLVLNPMVPIRNEVGATELPSAILGARRLRDKGFLTVADQARRFSSRTKLHSAIERFRLTYPNSTIVLLEPQADDGDMMLANPMNFAVRRRLLRYGYDSAARLLLERHELYAPVFSRQKIATDVERLKARRWELQ